MDWPTNQLTWHPILAARSQLKNYYKIPQKYQISKIPKIPIPKNDFKTLTYFLKFRFFVPSLQAKCNQNICAALHNFCFFCLLLKILESLRTWKHLLIIIGWSTNLEKWYKIFTFTYFLCFSFMWRLNVSGILYVRSYWEHFNSLIPIQHSSVNLIKTLQHMKVSIFEHFYSKSS